MKRISELVRAVKDYSYMDQMPEQEVDIHDGIETTLIMLKHRLKNGVEVVREYDRDIPRMVVRGRELNPLETSRARLIVDGEGVEIDQQSGFPYEGRSTLTIHAREPVRFALKIRVPPWAAPLRSGAVTAAAGWATLDERTWHDGDCLGLVFNLQGRVIPGDFTNFARSALAWGPFVLAVDQSRNPGFDSLQALRV